MVLRTGSLARPRESVLIVTATRGVTEDGTWHDPPVYAIVARDEQRIHFRHADPPTCNPDKYCTPSMPPVESSSREPLATRPGTRANLSSGTVTAGSSPSGRIGIRRFIKGLSCDTEGKNVNCRNSLPKAVHPLSMLNKLAFAATAAVAMLGVTSKAHAVPNWHLSPEIGYINGACNLAANLGMTTRVGYYGEAAPHTGDNPNSAVLI